jgi:putative DNA primase/helicase
MTAVTVADVVGKALKGRRNGRGYLCRCPAHDDKTPSLSVGTGRDERLLVQCFAGCDPRDVLAELRRMGILDTRERGNRRAGVTKRAAPVGPPPDPKAEADLQLRVDVAWSIFDGAGDIRGTLGERYLTEHRGITITRDAGADPYLFDRLRFHPSCPFGRERAPAVVAAVTGPSGHLRGVWRIRLDDEGGKAGRFGLGDCRGGAVRLVEALDGDHVAVAEGVEDALAFMQLAKIPTWAGCSTSGVAGMVLPPRFRRVTVVADADEPGMKAARKLASRIKAEGRAVRIIRPPTGCKDANAALIGEVAV